MSVKRSFAQFLQPHDHRLWKSYELLLVWKVYSIQITLFFCLFVWELKVVYICCFLLLLLFPLERKVSKVP